MSTNGTKSVIFCVGVSFLPLELLKHSEIIRTVIGLCNGNDTMLRRSNQLVLVAENDHFEGSIDLKEDMIIIRLRTRVQIRVRRGGGEIFPP